MTKSFCLKVIGAFALAALFASASEATGRRVVVGSKIFTEGYILGEVAAQIVEHTGCCDVARKLGLGSTGLVFEAIKGGSIDLYADYSGTIAETILKNPDLISIQSIREALMPLGLTISDSLGFNNTYAIAVSEAFAQKHHLEKISDLLALSKNVKAAFSYEFMDRKDGYAGLVSSYRLEFDPKNVNRMEHSLVYQAVDNGSVDMIEVYSTDANISKFHLKLLKDDLAYFPHYEAIWVARLDFVQQHKELWRELRRYEGKITEEKMQSMNAEADIGKVGYSTIAQKFLGYPTAPNENLLHELFRRTQEHLSLVGVALLFSLIVGIPLGILAARFEIAGQSILAVSALVQTIPSLALLCILIPIFGIGLKPALVALCLYSLLPVVLNTFTGIRGVQVKHLENARAFGLSNRQILIYVTLPLASPMILTGVQAATIVSIGTATLAALVGAGGYGALIVSGLSLNDMNTVLSGALPAALMALVAHFIFEGLRKILVPKSLLRRAEI